MENGERERKRGKNEKGEKENGSSRGREEWEGRRGAERGVLRVAGRLSVNGSLEKRSSRTIYILSMRQNYIIAHTRNHTAHTQD